MKLKICGMREPLNIAEIAKLRPDYMGFVFYEHSPRYAGVTSSESVSRLPREIKRVGVFVNAETQTIIETAARYMLDYAQLHGDETPEVCRKISRVLPVVKAIAVSSAEDLRNAVRYAGYCEMLLFDTKTNLPGGSGEKFDWSILNEYQGETPFLLSGGITPEDAERIRAISHPRFAGIDLNSRFETSPGIKDFQKLRTFIKKLR